jgi:H+/Cl- antiporter ClcA
MTQPTASPRRHSNAYNIFILVLTVISLVIMVVMLLPLDDATIGLLQFYDNLICVIFLIDFFLLSICLSSGFPGGFVFPLLFSAGSLGYAIHLIFPFIPLSVAIVGMMAGIGGAIMRMPFTVILLMLMLSNPALMPISTVAAFTGFLSATLLEAGNARRAMYQASEKRKDLYVSSEAEAGN